MAETDRRPLRADVLRRAAEGAPTLAVEIASPGMSVFALVNRIEALKADEALDLILLADPEQPRVRLYQRDGTRAWTTERITGIEAVVELPKIGVTLCLADVYGDRPAGS